jgi:hypothetical protein
VVVVVSAVSMCNQKLRVYVVQPAGIDTDWLAVSVCVVPYPSSHASQLPECGGSDVELLITPELRVHGVVVVPP